MIYHVTSAGDDLAKILIKFDNSVKYGSLKAESFSIESAHATPESYTGVALTIGNEDYNTVSRTLALRFSEPLIDGHPYKLKVTGLESPAGTIYLDDEAMFLAFGPADPVIPIPPPPMHIVDHSIISVSDSDFGDGQGGDAYSSGGFGVVGSDPQNGEWHVEPSHEDGRVELIFSNPVDVSYINDKYIRVSRKLSQLAPIRWEKIPVKYSVSHDLTRVYVDFPSIEETPRYRTPDLEYFQEGYSYRIKVRRGLRGMNGTGV